MADDAGSAGQKEPPKPGTTETVLRDLQSLLRKTLGPELIVIEYSTVYLLPKGENYASTMVKIEAIVQKSKTGKPEELHLVGKMLPETEFQKSLINSTVSFRKEIFVFEQLVPMYEKIERDAGLEEDAGRIRFLPKFYGARYSLDPEVAEADQDVVMLMENLKLRGYRTMSRKHGLDLEHAKMAIKALGRYHGLGMACVQKYPDFVSLARSVLEENMMKDMTAEEFKKIPEDMKGILMQDPRFAAYEEQLDKSMAYDFDAVFRDKSVNLWSTFTHGDFWVNNMMFLHDDPESENHPLDIKFVDFQMSTFTTGLKDLPYFFCGSCNSQVTENHIDELLEDYHAAFMDILEKTGCDLSAFTMESLREHLKMEASKMLLIVLMVLKVFTLEISQDFDLNEMVTGVMQGDVNQEFRERAYNVIKLYVRQKWA